jgi:hypothetical protein
MEGVTTLITLTQRLPCPGRAPLPVGVGPSSYLDPPPFDVRSVDHEDVLSEREGQIEVAQPGEVQLNTFSKEGRGRPEIKARCPSALGKGGFPPFRESSRSMTNRGTQHMMLNTVCVFSRLFIRLMPLL